MGNLLANRVEIYDSLRRPVAGWPQPTEGGVKATPAVADLDGDGKPEILAGAEDGKLYAWHAGGRPVAGWPVRVGDDPEQSYRILATPAVGDLDGDGRPEVVVPLADGRIYALGADGAPRWSADLGGERDSFGSQVINSSPRIADLDGDGAPEIVVGSTDRHVYVFGADGALRWRYVTGDMILGAPAVADLAPARPGLEVAVGSGDSYVYLFDKGGALIWRRATGWTVRSTPVAADLDGDGDLELLAGGDDKRVWAWQGDGSRVRGWPRAAGGSVSAAPVVGDLDGDGKPEVVAGAEDASVYAWHADGSALPGYPVAVSASVRGAPALAQLDGDAAAELVVGDSEGLLRLMGTPPATYLPIIRR